MSQVPYYVNDALVEICNELGLTNLYESVGGRTVFTASNWQTALDSIYDAIDEMIYDEDPANDATAFGYQDILDNSTPSVIYWSTEAHSWLN